MPLRMELDYDRGVPVYRQIFEAVVSALASGELGHDERLPTIHELAGLLEINPNTVVRAYRDLESEGWVVSQRGRGTFPVEAAKKKLPDRTRIMRELYDRVVAEAARHRIGPEELIETFRRLQCGT
jgi:GntR family transcriptional regulator